jgi:hypothetical protein
MLLKCQLRAENFQLRVDVVEMSSLCLKISSFMLVLLRCQLRAEDFHLCAKDFQHVDVVEIQPRVEDFQLRVDVDVVPASC